MSSQSTSKPVVLTPNDWDTSAIKYMKPFVTKSGSKSISIISKQSNRSLTISTPWMMTWGCSDFTDANGDSDGKFNIALNFPNEDERTPETDLFLQKLKDFENQILDDAVKMSETWWGESMSREICKHTFFPVLKYSKNKDTHKVDYSKPPSFRAKVPNYDGVWKIEIYNTKGELIFPSENSEETPDNIITKLSRVACVLQSSGIWIGGKGWGVTWKLVQCAIKPKEIVSITGRCLISLPAPLATTELEVQQTRAIKESEPVEQPVQPVVVSFSKVTSPLPPSTPLANQVVSSTEAEDTDDEMDDLIDEIIKSDDDSSVSTIHKSTPDLTKISVSDTLTEKLPPPPAASIPVRKVIKKTVVAPAPAPAPEPVVVEETPLSEPTNTGSVTEVTKKKVVKKIVSVK